MAYRRYMMLGVMTPTTAKLLWFMSLGCLLPLAGQNMDVRAERFRVLMRGSPRLPVTMTEFLVQPPQKDWAIDFVSSLAVDRDGLIYLFQRVRRRTR